MLRDRRNFMSATGLAAGAAMLGQLGAEEPFPVSETPEGDVANLVSRYGKLRKITRDSSGLVTVTASIGSHERMARVLTRQDKLPFDQIKVLEEHLLEISHRGQKFLISHQA